MKIRHIGEIVRNVTASRYRAVDATAAGEARRAKLQLCGGKMRNYP